jgi:hypothetical protein
MKNVPWAERSEAYGVGMALRAFVRRTLIAAATIRMMKY